METQLSFQLSRGWARVLRVVDQIAIDRFLRSNLTALGARKPVQFDRKKGHLALNSKYPDRSHKFFNAENVDDSPQVIGQYMQTHFCTHMFKGLRQEVSRPHPEFERTEDMFNGASSLFHLSRVPVQAILHGIQNCFVFPSPDSPFLTGGALSLQRTLLAG